MIVNSGFLTGLECTKYVSARTPLRELVIKGAYNESCYRVAIARPGAEGVAMCTGVEAGLKG